MWRNGVKEKTAKHHKGSKKEMPTVIGGWSEAREIPIIIYHYFVSINKMTYFVQHRNRLALATYCVHVNFNHNFIALYGSIYVYYQQHTYFVVAFESIQRPNGTKTHWCFACEEKARSAWFRYVLQGNFINIIYVYLYLLYQQAGNHFASKLGLWAKAKNYAIVCWLCSLECPKWKIHKKLFLNYVQYIFAKP